MMQGEPLFDVEYDDFDPNPTTWAPNTLLPPRNTKPCKIQPLLLERNPTPASAPQQNTPHWKTVKLIMTSLSGLQAPITASLAPSSSLRPSSRLCGSEPSHQTSNQHMSPAMDILILWKY
jgi:hypothetical protein